MLEDTLNYNICKVEKEINFTFENDNFQIQFYTEGLKIYSNNKFLVGYYNNLNLSYLMKYE